MERIRYQIEYADGLIKQISKIPKNVAVRIKKAIDERLTTCPNDAGKPLLREWKNHRRLRVGDYRIIYKVIEDRVIVFIVEIDHRKDVYED